MIKTRQCTVYIEEYASDMNITPKLKAKEQDIYGKFYFRVLVVSHHYIHGTLAPHEGLTCNKGI